MGRLQKGKEKVVKARTNIIGIFVREETEVELEAGRIDRGLHDELEMHGIVDVVGSRTSRCRLQRAVHFGILRRNRTTADK